MPLTEIDSLQNPRIKLVKGLMRKRQRDRLGLFLLEGEREVARGLEAGLEATQILLCPKFFKHGAKSEARQREHLSRGTPVVYLSEKVFRACSYRENPDGFLALCKVFRTSLDDLPHSPNPLILIVESVEKPGNLGALLRTADATGVDAVILNDPVTDTFNPNVIRASAGVAFSVPSVVATPVETLEYLKAHQIPVVATLPTAGTSLFQTSFSGPTAIILGSEKAGLSNFWLNGADVMTSIPMSGQADSLNVSSTAAVLLYEAVRQRASAMSQK